MRRRRRHGLMANSIDDDDELLNNVLLVCFARSGCWSMALLWAVCASKRTSRVAPAVQYSIIYLSLRREAPCSVQRQTPYVDEAEWAAPATLPAAGARGHGRTSKPAAAMRRPRAAGRRLGWRARGDGECAPGHRGVLEAELGGAREGRAEGNQGS